MPGQALGFDLCRPAARATLPVFFMVKFVICILFVCIVTLAHPGAAALGQAAGLAADKNPAELGFDAKKLDAVFAVQQKLIEDKHAPSNVGLIARRGKVVYHRAAASEMAHDRAITDQTMFPIWSMTKPITSVAAMILHEGGKFKLDNPVADSLPELAKVKVQIADGKTVPLAKPITSRDLFRHTAGFDGYGGL